MALTIDRGVKAAPARVVLYGVAGIGKSTLAAELFPGQKALFIDAEESTGQLNVARVTPKKFSEIQTMLVELARDRQGFEAVVIDTADWAEHMASEALVSSSGKKSIEDFGFGKGFTMLTERVKEMLTACDACIAAGLHVVLIAHSKVVRVSPPDESDGFDRYELKLTKQTAPLVKEWADALLFLKFGLQLVEGRDGKMKGESSGLRMIHSAPAAAWDAKNRFGLPEVVSYSTTEEAVAALAPIFRKGVRLPATPAAAQPPAAPVSAPALEPGITEATEAAIRELGKASWAAEIIERAVQKVGNPLDCFSEKVALKLLKQLQDEAAKIETPAPNSAGRLPAPAPAPTPEPAHKFPFAPSVLAWLEANEPKVNDYLQRLNCIKAGETFRDLPIEAAEKINGNPARLAKQLGIEGPK